MYSMRMHQRLPFLMRQSPNMAVFWSKIEFFRLRKTVEDPPPIVRVLDAKNEVLEAYTKTQFAARICTKMCQLSFKEMANNARFFVEK